MMNKHYGQIVEHIVRKEGYSISGLSREAGINRRTIYNWFQQQNLKSDIIYRIGIVIKHDFSKECPELFNEDEFSVASNTTINKIQPKFDAITHEDVAWKDKYIMLLEKFNQRLEFPSYNY